MERYKKLFSKGLWLSLMAVLFFSRMVYAESEKQNINTSEITESISSQLIHNKEKYKNKIISILGDSISTFDGYIPEADGINLEHQSRYPQDNLLTDVNLTWWMSLIHDLDAKLGVNDSWRGTKVSNTVHGNSKAAGEDTCLSSLTRIRNLGSNGIPDVILFYGGTNDIGQDVPLGSFNAAEAPVQVDLTTTIWDSFANAYVAAIMRLQCFYPESEIIAMLPTYTKSYYTDQELQKYNDVMQAVCEHYGVTCVDLRHCGITINELPDGIHPNAVGMKYIKEAVLDTLISNE